LYNNFKLKREKAETQVLLPANMGHKACFKDYVCWEIAPVIFVLEMTFFLGPNDSKTAI